MSTAQYMGGKEFEHYKQKYSDIVVTPISVRKEKADTRCLQSLPAEIRLAKAVVNPGTLQLKAELRDRHEQPVRTVDLGQVNAEPGEKKFVIFRTLD